MFTPRQLDNIPNDLVDLYAEFETTVISDIARRIRKTAEFTATAQYQAELMTQLGYQRTFLIREIASLTRLSQREVTRLFNDANIKSQTFFDKILVKAGLKKPQNQFSKRLIDADIKKTNNNLQNLTMTTANTSQQLFIRSSNLAHLQVSTGAFDFETAVKNGIKSASREGLNVLYPSGATRTIESAVRMVVLTGVNQTTLKIQENNMKELGIDLVEVSAHSGARHDHAVWQGKVYRWKK